jgi:hypothetical protein
VDILLVTFRCDSKTETSGVQKPSYLFSDVLLYVCLNGEH